MTRWESTLPSEADHVNGPPLRGWGNAGQVVVFTRAQRSQETAHICWLLTQGDEEAGFLREEFWKRKEGRETRAHGGCQALRDCSGGDPAETVGTSCILSSTRCWWTEPAPKFGH